jgi:hypothetical protein
LRSQEGQTGHALRKCADKETDHPHNRQHRTLYLPTLLDDNLHAQPDSDWKDGLTTSRKIFFTTVKMEQLLIVTNMTAPSIAIASGVSSSI